MKSYRVHALRFVPAIVALNYPHPEAIATPAPPASPVLKHRTTELAYVHFDYDRTIPALLQTPMETPFPECDARWSVAGNWGERITAYGPNNTQVSVLPPRSKRVHFDSPGEQLQALMDSHWRMFG